MTSLACIGILIEPFVGRPWLAFSVAAIFVVLGLILWAKQELERGIFVNLTGVMWILYGLWEDFVGGGREFRFDILPIFFVLGIMSLVSLSLIRSGW